MCIDCRHAPPAGSLAAGFDAIVAESKPTTQDIMKLPCYHLFRHVGPALQQMMAGSLPSLPELLVIAVLPAGAS